MRALTAGPVTLCVRAVVGHHSRQPSEDLGEQSVESNVADTLGHGGRADQIEEDNDALLLARAIVATRQKAGEDIGADKLRN